MLETYHGLALDRFQRESMEAIHRGEDVIVAAPTGAGKTLIAHYAIERALQAGRRVIYTAPIKALSNQKYRDLCTAYPGKVGISTGDVSIDAQAPAVIMTTEIFRNTIFEDPERLKDVAWVIFDEVHYLDDPERGTVWEESLIFAPEGIRVLALSATVSNLDEFADWLREVRRSQVKVVLETHRPVPLSVSVASVQGGIRPVEQVRQLHPSRGKGRGRGKHHHGRDRKHESLSDTYQRAWRKLVHEVQQRDELPLLFFLFSRDACERLAEACAREDLSASAETRRAAVEAFDQLVQAFDLDRGDPQVRQLQHLIARGISFHHAGLMPALKEVIERLFSGGHVRLLCATETFALGINMPARSVAFEGLRKWDGKARVPLRTREFQQMAGRAGRRGIDERGTVYLTYDPDRDDPHVVTQLVKGPVEPVESQFNLSYGTLLNLYERLGDKIYEACERSFANFKARRRAGKGGVHHERPLGAAAAGPRPPEGGPHIVRRRGGCGRRPGRGPRRPEPQRAGPPPPSRYADIVAQVRVKLGILSELQYMDSRGAITPRGRFAMQVFGNEMAMTELVWSGLFEDATPEQVAVVACAVVHESRKGVYYGGEDPRRVLGKHAYRLAHQVIHDLWRLESERGVRQPTKELDWSLSGVVWSWVNGAEFAALRELTDASDGDVVRTMRQTIQLLRLTVRPLRQVGREPLAGLMRDAMKLLKRDLVDAEWQLRRGAELEAERAAGLEELPPELRGPGDSDVEELPPA